jgi:hypothetical protein
MARWQRRATHAVLSVCAGTGLVWLVLQDGWGWPPPKTTFWWISHGVSGTMALVVLGAALTQHILGALRQRLNLGWGLLTLGALSIASTSALLLLYGPEPWREATRWAHLGAAFTALIAFPGHVASARSRGRRR